MNSDDCFMNRYLLVNDYTYHSFKFSAISPSAIILSVIKRADFSTIFPFLLQRLQYSMKSNCMKDALQKTDISLQKTDKKHRILPLASMYFDICIQITKEPNRGVNICVKIFTAKLTLYSLPVFAIKIKISCNKN